MKAGTTFRGSYLKDDQDNDEDDDRELEIRLLDAGIESYIKKSSELNEVPPGLFREWHRLFMGKLTERYKNTVARYNEPTREDRKLDNAAVDCLRVIQRDYAILTADKAKNMYVIHCKPWLAKQVHQETETTSTYEQAKHDDGNPMELQEIIDADWEFVNAEGLAKKHSPDEDGPNVPKIQEKLLFAERVPTFGAVVKTVKDNKIRFLAKSHKTSLSQLSQWITKSLKIMMPMSEEIWRSLFQAAGVVATSSWVITSTKQARKRMDRMQAMGKKPNGGQQT
jgi:hypothetical protein